MFMHAPYVASSYFDYAAYGQSLGRAGSLAAGLQYFGFGTINQLDATGSGAGTLSPHELAASLGYAYEFEGGFSIGAAGKFIQESLITSAQTGALDLGLLSPSFLDERLRWAFTADNLGAPIRFDNDKEDLPLAFRVGGAYRLTDDWLASLDVVAPRGGSIYGGAGTEYRFHEQGFWSFSGRAGYNTQTLSSGLGFSGAAVGFGIAYKGFEFDYAFAPMGELGLTHRISVTCGFEAAPPQRPQMPMPEQAGVKRAETDESGPVIFEAEVEKEVNRQVQKLKGPDSRARARAAMALGELRTHLAVEPLITALRDKSAPVREGAVQALGKIGDVAALNPLFEMLKDEEPRVRASAAIVVGKLGDSDQVMVPLMRLTQDESELVRKAALSALQSMHPAGVDEVIHYMLQ